MQTTDLVQATYNAAQNAVVGVLGPQSYGRRVVLMTINGPASSQLEIFRGYIPDAFGRVTSIFPADSRTYDASGLAPIVIRAGESATFRWTRGAVQSGAVANCSIISEVS